MIVQCSHCKRQINKSPSQLRQSKSGNTFCSQTCAATFNNHLNPKRLKEGHCHYCGHVIASSRKYCSVDCMYKSPNNSHTKPFKTLSILEQQNRLEHKKESVKKSVIAYRQRQKQRAVVYKGGKCIRCGYDRCIAALTFHHRDPHQKDFAISKVTRRWDVLQQELDKCDLLCIRCHVEVHNTNT